MGIKLTYIITFKKLTTQMGKDTKKNNQKKPNSSKNGKVIEVEDFFTSFLAKKVRNINKKLGHIKELEGLKRDELKKDQLEMIARKDELLAQIEENNAIKNLYLEAYSKKGEYEAQHEQEAPKEQPKVEAPVAAPVDNTAILAEAARDAEKLAINRATESLSRLFAVTQLFGTEASVEQFSAESGLNSSDLQNLNDMYNQLVVRGANNDDHQQFVQTVFRNYVEGNEVRGTDSRSMPEMAALVDEVLRNTAFANFVPKAPVVVVESEPVVVVQEQQQVVEVKVESRKQSDIEAARKESMQQQNMFMEDDSEDEQEVREEQPKVVQANVTVTEQVESQAPVEEKKQEKKAEGDDDEDEWHTAARAGRQQYDGNNPNYRGNNRGGRGRGGRGGNRGGYKKDGERRERKVDENGNPIEGERRKFDGDRRPNTRGDGERGRGNRDGRGRGRGGRGRGYNKDGKPYDGERKPYRKQNTDGTPAEGAPLKEVGTLDQPPAKVETTEAQE